MSILWLAAICAALGIGCLLTPWHIGMTGVCLLLLAAVLLACHFLRGEKGKRWRRVLWSLAGARNGARVRHDGLYRPRWAG